MADNTSVWPIFRWANWGLSDDRFTGIVNSFYYSENLEVREDMRSIYPCEQAIIATWWATVTWTPVKILQISSSNWIVLSKKTIYILDWETNTVSSTTYTVTDNLCDAAIFGDKIFITTEKKLFSTSYSSPDFSNLDEIATLNTCNYHPLLTTSSALIVWDKNIIKMVLFNALSTAIDQITLSSNCVVKLLDFLWGYTRIIIEKDYYKNEIWLWDNSKDAINERIPMDWYKFYQSVVYKGQHYLVSNKGLGIINWYNYFIIKRFSNFTDNPNSICVYDDKIYIWGIDWIYIYWAKNKNYSEVLAKWTDCWTVWALASNYKDIVSSKSGKVWLWVDDETFEWELQTMAYYWASLSQIKQSLYLRVGYKIASSWNIKIYYRTEKNSWTELTQPWGLTKDWDMRSPFATTLKLNCEFQWIQFKFELTWWATHLYSADLYYNWMLD